MKKAEAPGGPCVSRQALQTLILCASKLTSLFVPALPSDPLAALRQAIWGIEQPIALSG